MGLINVNLKVRIYILRRGALSRPFLLFPERRVGEHGGDDEGVAEHRERDDEGDVREEPVPLAGAHVAHVVRHQQGVLRGRGKGKGGNNNSKSVKG